MYATPSSRAASHGGVDKPIRVMVVEDSAVIRGLLVGWLSEQKDMDVVARCANGLQALRAVAKSRAEVIVLDIEMPDMDGLTALPKLIQAVPGIKVVMASTLTRRNAEISIRALSMGASDYVPKPETTRGVSTSKEFRQEIINKVRALGFARRGEVGPPPEVEDDPKENFRAARPAAPARSAQKGPVKFRPQAHARSDVIAIGSSTGGPQALAQVIKDIGGGRTELPILIVQHMPKMFTTILAEHLKKAAGIACREAVDGEKIMRRQIYVAPGDYHMTVDDRGGAKHIKLDQTEPVHFCRPAVDPMFTSVAKAYGDRALAVVLTGMGQDGAVGVEAIAEARGAVLAQDKETSVVWGMPGAAANTGQCNLLAPLNEIGRQILTLSQGAKP